MFKIRADEGASREKQQNLVLGASTVAHMMKAVCNREEGETAMYYMSKPGSTLDDMYKALKKVLEKKSFFLLDDKCDAEVKKAEGKRPLMILVVMTLNDLNAILDAEYLSDSLESFRLLIRRFETYSGRETKISFTQYMYAPSRRDNHVKIAEMNAIIEKANKEIFSVATYDPNTRLLRPVKTGRPGNVTVYKPDGSSDNYHTDTSMTGNWILPGAYHVADKKLREITKDIRVFFNLAMQEANPKPWDAYDLDVKIDVDDVLPKFDPTDEYPSLASASLYASKAARTRNEETEERAPGDRVLSDFLDPAMEHDRDKPKRSRQGRDKHRDDERRRRREESLEDRRQQARQAARQKAKERLRPTKDEATKNKWQEIKDKAESVRPPVDARVHIEGEVANMSVEGEKEDEAE